MMILKRKKKKNCSEYPIRTAQLVSEHKTGMLAVAP
jgi:hypothetical protein